MKTFQTKAVRQSRPMKTKVLPALEDPAGLLDPLALRLGPNSSHAVLQITATPSVMLV